VWDVWLVLAGDCLVGSCLPRLLLARSLVCASVSLSVSSCSLLALSIDSPATYLPNASPHRVNTTRVPWCDGRCTCQLQSLSFAVDAAAAASLSLLLPPTSAAWSACQQLTSRMSIVCAISYQVVVLPHGGVRAVEPAPLQ